MLKIQVEGQANHVLPFLCDLQQRPQIELLHQEAQKKGMTGQVDVCVTCYVRHQPDQRLRMLQIVTTEGGEIRIPLLDVIQVEIEEGMKVFSGRVFDIFG